MSKKKDVYCGCNKSDVWYELEGRVYCSYCLITALAERSIIDIHTSDNEKSDYKITT